MKIAIVVNDKRRTERRHELANKSLPPLWAEKWEQMCIVNSIEFKKFDSFNPDFIDNLLAYNADRTLWRSIGNTLMKFKDEAQRQLLDRTGLRIVPNWNTHYLYDHKIRQSYLFKLHRIPQPETKVFFNEPYALDYIEKAEYPFVIKSDGGAGGKSFRFIEDKKQALTMVDAVFHQKGKWTGREYESHILYAQEYIPAPGIWRVWMFKDKLGVAHFVKNAPGTKRASGHGEIIYLPIPSGLFNMTSKINRGMRWDWSMYDMIWSKKHNKWLVLEITDTISDRDWKKRKFAYYREDDEWIPKEESILPPEYIFNLFVLEEMS